MNVTEILQDKSRFGYCLEGKTEERPNLITDLHKTSLHILGTFDSAILPQ